MFDAEERNDSQPMRRFFLRRLKDETGISATGRVLEGVLCQSGKVLVEWRSPMATVGIYDTFEVFEQIHVLAHPSSNEVIWIDPPLVTSPAAEEDDDLPF